MSQKLILYTKAGCHLCEGLQEKIVQIESKDFDLEVRDISTNEDWFEAYQYEVPVLSVETMTGEKIIPRPSPRISVARLQQLLQKYLAQSEKVEKY